MAASSLNVGKWVLDEEPLYERSEKQDSRKNRLPAMKNVSSLKSSEPMVSSENIHRFDDADEAIPETSNIQLRHTKAQRNLSRKSRSKPVDIKTEENKQGYVSTINTDPALIPITHNVGDMAHNQACEDAHQEISNIPKEETKLHKKKNRHSTHETSTNDGRKRRQSKEPIETQSSDQLTQTPGSTSGETTRYPKKRRPPDQNKSSYLTLLEKMPIKVVTKEEWEGIADAPIEPFTSSYVEPTKTFVLRHGIYTEVKLSNSASASNVPFGDYIGSSTGSVNVTIPVKTPLELAISVQGFCSVIYTICHGFLGGIAIAHIFLGLSIISTSNNYSPGFVEVYPAFARSLQTLFAFFATICLISTLDKYDVGSWRLSELCEIIHSRVAGTIILIIYLLTLVLNTASVLYDDLLALQAYSTKLIVNSEELDTWRILTLIRCVGAVLGWILITLFPYENVLLSNLKLLDETAIVEMNQDLEAMRY